MTTCKALEALEEITQRMGVYSRDPLTHANNTIDSMESIARAAITNHQGCDQECDSDCQCYIAGTEAPREGEGA